MFTQLIGDLLYPDNPQRRQEVAEAKKDILDLQNKVINSMNDYNEKKDKVGKLVGNNALLLGIVMTMTLKTVDKPQLQNIDLPGYKAPTYMSVMSGIVELGLTAIVLKAVSQGMRLAFRFSKDAMRRIFDSSGSETALAEESIADITEESATMEVLEGGAQAESIVSEAGAVTGDAEAAEIAEVGAVTGEMTAEGAAGGAAVASGALAFVGGALIFVGVELIIAAIEAAQEKEALEANLKQLVPALEKLQRSYQQMTQVADKLKESFENSIKTYNALHKILCKYKDIESTDIVFGSTPDGLANAVYSQQNLINHFGSMAAVFNGIRNLRDKGLSEELIVADLPAMALILGYEVKDVSEYYDLLKKIDDNTGANPHAKLQEQLGIEINGLISSLNPTAHSAMRVAPTVFATAHAVSGGAGHASSGGASGVSSTMPDVGHDLLEAQWQSKTIMHIVKSLDKLPQAQIKPALDMAAVAFDVDRNSLQHHYELSIREAAAVAP